ncbi:MAG: hypothetical protein LBH70_03645, partial [Spirochaetaceae bacterium]|nr:hypothetical protein [Spirochaetaceae bacterium]
MKKSTLFLAGMAALLLSFGLILTGCPTGSDDSGGNNNGGGSDNLPETLTAAEAKEFFTDHYKNASNEEDKMGVLMLISFIAEDTKDQALLDKLKEMEQSGTFPNDLSDLGLSDTFWQAVSEGWSDIKDFFEDGTGSDDPGTGGKGDSDGDGATPLTWTKVDDTTFSLSYIYGIAYGGGKFVAVGEHGKAAYSTDGI